MPNSSLVNSSRASPSPSRPSASPSPSIGRHLENIHLAADDDVLYVNAHVVSAPKSAPTTPASASRAAVPKATPPADKPRRPSSRLGLSLDGTAVLHELEAAAAAESRAAAVVAPRATTPGLALTVEPPLTVEPTTGDLVSDLFGTRALHALCASPPSMHVAARAARPPSSSHV